MINIKLSNYAHLSPAHASVKSFDVLSHGAELGCGLIGMSNNRSCVYQASETAPARHAELLRTSRMSFLPLHLVHRLALMDFSLLVLDSRLKACISIMLLSSRKWTVQTPNSGQTSSRRSSYFPRELEWYRRRLSRLRRLAMTARDRKPMSANAQTTVTLCPC